MTLVYDPRPMCGANVILRVVEGEIAEILVCIRKGGVCPMRTRQDDGGAPNLTEGSVCAASRDASEKGGKTANPSANRSSISPRPSRPSPNGESTTRPTTGRSNPSKRSRPK